MTDFPKKQKVRQLPNKDEMYALGRATQQLVPKNTKGRLIDAGLTAAEETNKKLVPVIVERVKKDSPAGPDVSTLRPLRVVRRKKRART